MSPIDIGDPHAVITGAVAMLAEYPVEVWAIVTDPVRGLPSRVDRLTLRALRSACDDAYAPIERRLERERAIESHRFALPPPSEERTAERQARIDAQVAEVRRMFPPRPRLGDISGHAARVAADLEARRARKASATDVDRQIPDHGQAQA